MKPNNLQLKQIYRHPYAFQMVLVDDKLFFTERFPGELEKKIKFKNYPKNDGLFVYENGETKKLIDTLSSHLANCKDAVFTLDFYDKKLSFVEWSSGTYSIGTLEGNYSFCVNDKYGRQNWVYIGHFDGQISTGLFGESLNELSNRDFTWFITNDKMIRHFADVPSEKENEKPTKDWTKATFLDKNNLLLKTIDLSILSNNRIDNSKRLQDPIIYEDKMYVAYNNWQLMCLDLKGEDHWYQQYEYNFKNYELSEGVIYAKSYGKLCKIDPKTGEIFESADIEQYFQATVLADFGLFWVYEDFVFCLAHNHKNYHHHFLIFNKHSLIYIGEVCLGYDDKEIVRIPTMRGRSCFIYEKGKMYVYDSSTVLRVYELDLTKYV